VIAELLERLERLYVLPGVARKMIDAVRGLEAGRAYDDVVAGPELAR
jgi:hypothetical protein